ncbi:MULTISPECIES: N-formylglutamate amidohydrolase [Sphingobacterium]|uniref:N-formylglutamate amidohydrolase n=1 Tax=Sphingobacterium litopenaei TaxID=2763500 RepID=A0ABR7YAU1_9SPHI|nr:MULTISPECIES: N-formylglutamate amidohydrolase [Sphingobacterium]MBD1428407.1 N-formylglutamate amidohydrolase [Sphingobacterium litopenaei]NGM71789.1 N-formylglutamate amidohydrolase [Sphingobacterium sp. SGL-16]
MSLEILYQIKNEESPFWAFAIHDGHQICEELIPYIALTDTERLREEDPYTAAIADLPINQFIVDTSRFQLDLNRDLENAVYLHPDQAWGLNVFRANLPSNYLLELYREHQSIYYIIERHLSTTIKKFGYFIIFDIHSYNAKRKSTSEEVDEQANPQINLGTYYNHEKWRGLIDEMSASFQKLKLDNKKIDVRENVKFKGGNLAQHIINQYGELGCVISIEFRKDFMDEWTGKVYPGKVEVYNQLLKNVLQSMNLYLQKIQV